MQETDTTKYLYDTACGAFNFTDYNFKLFKKRGQKDELVSSRSKTIVGCGLQHGDMIYLSYDKDSSTLSSEEPSCSNNFKGEFYQPSLSSSVNHG